jgi:hypothetical protein
MKQIFLPVVFILSALGAGAQQQANIGLKWAPTGLALGGLGFQGEYNFGKNSLTAKIGIPLNSGRTVSYDGNDARFHMKATSFLAGYRTYLSGKHMKGLYFEPFFKYVHHSSEGIGNSELTMDPITMSFTNNYNAIGVGAQLGVQFLIHKRFLIDLFFFGPEINSAENKFKAVETSTGLPWTPMQASEARQDILDFIDKFPFVRNKVDVMVDPYNKTVTADFRGALPGIRAGVSFGIIF